jgi:DNA-binding helix-hairpin-helix protein with protein kinase domain
MRDELLRPGQVLRMERGSTALAVGDRLGEGAFGVVHQARLYQAGTRPGPGSGKPRFAVKWFRPVARSERIRQSILALVQRGQPPHPAFVWPIDLVRSDEAPGFGYVMPLLSSRFVSLARMLDPSVEPDVRAVTTIGRELVEAFAALHSSGLCYRDISFGNLRVDPATAEVAIIDVDNVGVDGGIAFVKGTGPFMAPEVLRDEAVPSTITDLHSLAVLLFYLLMHGHPLEGKRTDESYDWEHDRPSELAITQQNFGFSPLFAFDPDDPSNRPLPGESASLRWPILPVQCRRAFIRAFTVGLWDASLHGRVKEGTWRRALLSLHDSVYPCPTCGATSFYDPEQPGQRCWQCGVPLAVPNRLEAPGGAVVLAEGAVVTSHHLYRDHGYREARARVEPHPRELGRLVMRNMTERTWAIVPDNEPPRGVAPGQLLAVRPMIIDYGIGRARIT